MKAQLSAHLPDLGCVPLGGGVQPVSGLLFVRLGQVLLDKGPHTEHTAQHLQAHLSSTAREGGQGQMRPLSS